MSVKKEKINGKMITVSIASTSLKAASYDTLKENFIEIVLNESMNWGEPVPRTKVNFEKLVNFAKKRIGEVIIELSNSQTNKILKKVVVWQEYSINL